MEQGGEAALEEIAQRAGAGAGTRSRHVVTWRELILATIEHASNGVNKQGRALLIIALLVTTNVNLSSRRNPSAGNAGELPCER